MAPEMEESQKSGASACWVCAGSYFFNSDGGSWKQEPATESAVSAGQAFFT